MTSEVQALLATLRDGSRRGLARAITLLESTRADHRAAAEDLLERLTRETPAGTSWRVGISGAPGVGKSTFIEAFGLRALEAGRRVAVLAVDPSSSVSGGSILGDKTRMPLLSRSTEAFIRPSPAAGSLGGVARRTRETLMLCEAAGYDLIVVETVGVGQSEVAVSAMTDLFLLILSPGGGDDLQGIKRGIMELVDIVVVNKSDGDLAAAAGRSAADVSNALELMRPRTPGWSPEVLNCSSLNGTGIGEVWHAVGRYIHHLGDDGLTRRRAEQAVQWFWNEIAALLEQRFRDHAGVRALLPRLEHGVREGAVLPHRAARQALAEFLEVPRYPRRADP
jgi:LAO/AO transport system kinase